MNDQNMADAFDQDFRRLKNLANGLERAIHDRDIVDISEHLESIKSETEQLKKKGWIQQ